MEFSSGALMHDLRWSAAAQEDFKGCLQKLTEKAQDEDGLVLLKFAKSELPLLLMCIRNCKWVCHGSCASWAMAPRAWNIPGASATF